MSDFYIRKATESDTQLILDFITKLAVYEKMEDQVVATVQTLKEQIFDKKIAQVIFAVEDGNEVGFALYFYNFSTFLGKSGIYLEDLFVNPESRGKGYGKALLSALAKVAIDGGCERLEWCCLNWNKPSIDFYLSLGAEKKTEWTTFRLSGKELVELATTK